MFVSLLLNLFIQGFLVLVLVLVLLLLRLLFFLLRISGNSFKACHILFPVLSFSHSHFNIQPNVVVCEKRWIEFKRKRISLFTMNMRKKNHTFAFHYHMSHSI